MIKIFDLCHRYKKQEPLTEHTNYSLNHVQLHIKKGSFVSIIGANGSGKSTLAKHFNGLLQPETGNIYIDGMDLSAKENIFKIRQICGMVFQNPDNQMIGSTVEEEVAFGLENLGVPTDKMRLQVDQTLTQMQMQDDAKRSTYQLSGGQKQKVSIASTLAMRPNCIVLDEATAMLEPTGRAEVMESILELNRKYGITIILITHYMNEAALSDYIYVMRDGMIVKEGIPRTVFLETELLESIGLDIPAATKIARALKTRGMISKEDILTEEELVAEVLQALKKERGD